MKVAVVGATGMVGCQMLKVLELRNFPVSELLLAASSKSVGKQLNFKGKMVGVDSISSVLSSRPALALFSAGAQVSKEWAPRFAEAGVTVIDNSSCWRQNPEIPLVVPEVNVDTIKPNHRIIANPNCSTIQLVVALRPLQLRYGIKRVVISTYQSVSGTGVKAVKQLFSEREGIKVDMVYHYPIDLNCIPHGGDFLPSGYTTEEQKLIDETHKILNDSTIAISPTVVRVPVIGGHSEAVNVELKSDFVENELVDELRRFPGIVVQDQPEANVYPMPRFAEKRDEVFVGRIRRDPSLPNTLNLWVVADNLRKGAATNAVQIAEYLYKTQLVRDL